MKIYRYIAPMFVVNIPNNSGAEKQYYYSGLYLKKKTAGDEQAYQKLKSKWVTPVSIAFGGAATAGGMYGVHELGEALLRKPFTGLTLEPFQVLSAYAFSNSMVGAVVQSLTALTSFSIGFGGVRAIGDEIARSRANLEYQGLNIYTASDEEIIQFIENSDFDVIAEVRNLREDDLLEIAQKYPKSEKSRRPSAIKPSPPGLGT